MFHNKTFLFMTTSIAFCAAALVYAAQSPDEEEATNQRIKPLAQVVLAPAQPAAAVGARSGEDMYKAVCSACHSTGAAGAPKVADNAAWAPRLVQGLDGLLKSATNGKNAMPAKGGAADATPEELTRAIVFMANQSGANFKEPK